MKISIINYGACNLESVRNAFYNLGAEIEIINESKKISSANKLILPGVGAANSALKYLREKEFVYEIKKFVKSGKPILGICLGFQLFAKKLYEHGISTGFEELEGEVVKFSKKKSFHIGWNKVSIDEELQSFFGIKNMSTFYFCHSFILKLKKNDNIKVGKTTYNEEFSSVVVKNNFIGTQFHPEKSQSNGKILLEKFIGWKP